MMDGGIGDCCWLYKVYKVDSKTLLARTRPLTLHFSARVYVVYVSIWIKANLHLGGLSVRVSPAVPNIRYDGRRHARRDLQRGG